MYGHAHAHSRIYYSQTERSCSNGTIPHVTPMHLHSLGLLGVGLHCTSTPTHGTRSYLAGNDGCCFHRECTISHLIKLPVTFQSLFNDLYDGSRWLRWVR